MTVIQILFHSHCHGQEWSEDTLVRFTNPYIYLPDLKTQQQIFLDNSMKHQYIMPRALETSMLTTLADQEEMLNNLE